MFQRHIMSNGMLAQLIIEGITKQNKANRLKCTYIDQTVKDLNSTIQKIQDKGYKKVKASCQKPKSATNIIKNLQILL